MPTLVQVLLNTLGPTAMHEVSTRLNADEGATQRAVSAAIPLIISALGKNASTSEGAQALSHALEKNHDGSVLRNVNDALANPAVAADGAAILRHVLGDKRQSVEKGLSAASGIDAASAAQLLNLLAPLVMGQLGQQKRAGGLNADDIADLLGGERREAKGLLGGLFDIIDADDDGSIVDDVLNMGSKLGKMFGKN
ncbi:MAG: DUF937 domain-containing protein [Caldilineaceae bacterium]|nr:DUF937 domain-containing protein [Caldilineaceae bacterium]